MQLQKQFVARFADRLVDRDAVIATAKRIYSLRHAARVVAEAADFATSNDRLLALVWNVVTWAKTRGEVMEPTAFFYDPADVAAAHGEWLPGWWYEAPQGASKRQMARLYANFEAMGLSPADGFALVCDLDGRPFVTRAERFADTSKGFVGKCVGWTDRVLRARGITRPENPLDWNAPIEPPMLELDAFEPWCDEFAAARVVVRAAG